MEQQDVDPNCQLENMAVGWKYKYLTLCPIIGGHVQLS